MNKGTKNKTLAFDSEITALPFIGDAQAQKLLRLGITTVRDLLFHFPIKYRDTSNIVPISQLMIDREGVIQGEVQSIKTNYTRYGKTITKAVVKDDSGTANIIWFNQRFISQAIKANNSYIFELKLPDKPAAKDFYCIEFEKVVDSGEQSHLGKLTPVYDQTLGISSKWLRARINGLKASIDKIATEWLPEEIVMQNSLLPLHEALMKVHFPEKQEDIDIARGRLAFDEMLILSLKLEERRKALKSRKAVPFPYKQKDLTNFISTLKFALTKDQNKVITEILEDLSKPFPMNRILNGDVGSGKTVVAACIAYITALQGYSTLIMAPTTVLAQQHYKSLNSYLEKFNIKVQILTSGEILEPTIKNQVIVGTHAILYEQEMPPNIGLVIVDEQHRFGVNQREKLRLQSQQEVYPHYLTMTATPIPRTLATVIYGDMDISIINELPKNRLPIESKIVPPSKVDDCYDWIRERVVSSNYIEQAYIIFPLIEESEKSDLKAATEAFKSLSQTHFKDLKVGLLHGKLKDKEKVSILNQFKEKEIHILISTTVIEVGIDVADATMIVIENGERFGLAQLHQLRGRVGRGDKQSFCFVIPSPSVSKGGESMERLKYFSTHNSGFDVAQFDLERRGPGEVYGVKQSGIPDLKIAKITDVELLSKTREVARVMLKAQ